MADYQTAEARLLADLERVPVVRLEETGAYGWHLAWGVTEDGTRLTWGSCLFAAAEQAVQWAWRRGLPEPVLVLPDGTHIAASDFLAREGGAL